MPPPVLLKPVPLNPVSLKSVSLKPVSLNVSAGALWRRRTIRLRGILGQGDVAVTQRGAVAVHQPHQVADRSCPRRRGWDVHLPAPASGWRAPRWRSRNQDADRQGRVIGGRTRAGRSGSLPADPYPAQSPRETGGWRCSSHSSGGRHREGGLAVGGRKLSPAATGSAANRHCDPDERRLQDERRRRPTGWPAPAVLISQRLPS
jgi:hypothetical protein